MSARKQLRRVCVFCGSRPGRDPRYAAAARELGAALVASQIGLVFGGGSVGLMGVVADAVLDLGGEVIGVIPEALATKELLHPRVNPMHVVDSMHARKALMTELSDAFIALPGGYGTFEELFEVVTWAQLGMHAKPAGLLNVAGYFDPLSRFLEHAIAEEFIKPRHRDLLLVGEDPQQLLTRLQETELPQVRKWLGTDET